MSSIEEHLEVLRKANASLAGSCPWLSEGPTGGEYTHYGDKGALCKPSQKVEAGRATSRAYTSLRHLEFDHLSEVRRMLRDELSRRRDLEEETGRFLVKDLFEKCEQIASCIACDCTSAVSAHYNLETLLELLGSAST